MPTVSPWRVPRTQLDIHAEHIALRLLLACPQLIDRCTIELQERLRAGHDEIGAALLERAQTALSARVKSGAVRHMNKRLAPLTSLLHLNECECELLRLCFMALENSLLMDVLSEVESRGRHGMISMLWKVLSANRTQLTTALRGGALVRAGLIPPFELRVCTDSLLGRLLQACLEPDPKPETMLKHVLAQAPAGQCQIQDFDHMLLSPASVTSYIRAARERNKGVHILLHGPTGTGKTEFSRVLAANLGWTLYEVPVEDSEQHSLSGRNRIAQYALSQRILERGEAALLAFDEAEDLFPDPRYSWFHSTDQALPKGWINRLLENTPVPTVWMANEVAQIDPAILRRFDLIIEVKAMPLSKRRQLVDDRLGELPISPAFRDRMAAYEDLAPAEVERLARVADAFSVTETTQIEPMLQRAMAGSRRAMGMPTRPRTAYGTALYQPRWTNADRDLGQLADRLAQRSAARLCLYGPSGTGKTAFAHYLSRVAERPLIAKRASDLLHCYLGGTEKRIAAAFDRAREEGAILLIDEAESFLIDRQRAQRSWEVTQVNELLAQMEDYDGLLVMTTNLFDNLDPAVFRRFDLKVKFDYLNKDQRFGLLTAFAELIPLVSNPLARQAAEAHLARLDRLTPGDYALVARQAQICGAMSVSEFAASLASEQAQKLGRCDTK